jgi:hypothetical protein
MDYLKKDKRETVEWFKDNFSLYEEKEEQEPKAISNSELLKIIGQAPAAYKIQVKNKWESLPNLNEAQVNYLKKRGIDADKLIGIAKNNNGFISCPIYDLTGMITLQSRTIKPDGPRFMIEK